LCGTYKFLKGGEVHMEVVKNGNGKTVCRADGITETVEIINKHFKTVITFLKDGTFKVINTTI
jgi:hypothetical protein